MDGPDLLPGERFDDLVDRDVRTRRPGCRGCSAPSSTSSSGARMAGLAAQLVDSSWHVAGSAEGAGSSGSMTGPHGGKAATRAMRSGRSHLRPLRRERSHRLLQQPQPHDVAQEPHRLVDPQLVAEVGCPAGVGGDRLGQLDTDQRPGTRGDESPISRRRWYADDGRGRVVRGDPHDGDRDRPLSSRVPRRAAARASVPGSDSSASRRAFQPELLDQIGVPATAPHVEEAGGQALVTSAPTVPVNQYPKRSGISNRWRAAAIGQGRPSTASWYTVLNGRNWTPEAS